MKPVACVLKSVLTYPAFVIFAAFPAWFTLFSPALAQSQEVAQASCFVLDGASEHYFGEIEQSASVEHTFTFTNGCSETVEISSVRASCGCTATVLSRRVIPPGGTAQVGVNFTPPRGSRGPVTKTISVYLKDRQDPHSVLRISASIKTGIEIEPAYIQLTDVSVGTPVTTTVSVRNVSDRSIKVANTGLNITSYRDTDGSGRPHAFPAGGGTVTPEVLSLAPGESGILTLSFTPENVGQLNGSVGLTIGANSSVVYLGAIVKEKAAAE